ncbi:sugar ABC transporter permease [Streptomyces chartreusis]|uniref:ABC transporter permease subunit n=1 Tax=Streptomyces chartreusis TaxID=1969 RepID=A0A7H8TG55_STRCX|nr:MULTISPECIES: ABC transporter permease subunit [Streptomyces]MBT1091595.1 ABC transporter permease subunit [Streptomyces sp. Tu102]QEV70649.1 ABC transporter permease subunit [Streptomyces chartreusis]QKZ22022.1 ABC transporter permease subunit [Streptomyces chartreusis]RSN98489.1 ABC transporter permease [Streptomyces sp. WAC 05379]GGX09330.1 ABC transporter permease [Streptomyces chartreusis]
MTTTTVENPVNEKDSAKPAAPRQVRRGENSRRTSVVSHGILIVASLIALFPVAWLVFLSLGPDKDDYLHPGGIWKKMTLDNYTFVLQETKFFDWLTSTMIVTLGTTLIGVVISATTGYAVSRMRFPGYKKFMWVLLVTQMFPVAVLMVPMYQILSEVQLIDNYLGLILVYCSTTVPYCAWLMKGYFDTIPFEIDEAGRVDGLSPFGTFARLILPLAKPGLAVAAFYSFLTAFGEVAFASTFMLSDTKYTFAVGLQTFVSEHDAQRNLMAATAVLIAIPVSAFFYFVQKNLVTGLTAGGTKG